MAQAEQLALLQEARLHPHGVESRSSVTLRTCRQAGRQAVNASRDSVTYCGFHCCHLGHDETVVVEVPWIVVAVLHGVEEEHGHDLGHAAARRGVSGQGTCKTPRHGRTPVSLLSGRIFWGDEDNSVLFFFFFLISMKASRCDYMKDVTVA